jgi:hypothetical protein
MCGFLEVKVTNSKATTWRPQFRFLPRHHPSIKRPKLKRLKPCEERLLTPYCDG